MINLFFYVNITHMKKIFLFYNILFSCEAMKSPTKEVELVQELAALPLGTKWNQKIDSAEIQDIPEITLVLLAQALGGNDTLVQQLAAIKVTAKDFKTVKNEVDKLLTHDKNDKNSVADMILLLAARLNKQDSTWYAKFIDKSSPYLNFAGFIVLCLTFVLVLIIFMKNSCKKENNLAYKTPMVQEETPDSY